MKEQIVRVANQLLKPLGARIVGSRRPGFDMSSALQRVADRGFDVRTVFDIGASDGKWSREAMHQLPSSQFIAVEPLEERRGALEALKRTTSRFEYELCVAGEVDEGTAALTVADDLDGSSVDAKGGVQRQVPIRTIDSIVAKRGLKGPFLLKFDTHGYELPILRGCAETLRQTQVVVMEVYNFKIAEQALRFHEMCAHLERLGFRCFDLADPMLREHDRALWQLDLFFCRSDDRLFHHEAYR